MTEAGTYVGYYCKGIFGFLFVFVCGTSRLHRHELVVVFFFLFLLFVVCGFDVHIGVSAFM